MINFFARRREIACDHQINHLWLSRSGRTGHSIIEDSVILDYQTNRGVHAQTAA
jgi:hypothetical protein